jgi:hypothetical protein
MEYSRRLLDFCDGVWRACTTIKRLTDWDTRAKRNWKRAWVSRFGLRGGPSHGIGLGETDTFITVKALERQHFDSCLLFRNRFYYLVSVEVNGCRCLRGQFWRPY